MDECDISSCIPRYGKLRCVATASGCRYCMFLEPDRGGTTASRRTSAPDQLRDGRRVYPRRHLGGQRIEARTGAVEAEAARRMTAFHPCRDLAFIRCITFGR